MIYSVGCEYGIRALTKLAAAAPAGQFVLLRDILVPAKVGGLSGAPVVDGNGLLVGIVSNSMMDPQTGGKFFSPCRATDLAAYLDGLPL